MFRIRKTMEISASHQLTLGYSSPCRNLHGHNYYITVYIKADKLNQDGMVVDFTDIKKCVHDYMDHKHLNDLFEFNPTAENMAYWIAVHLDVGRTVDDIERGLHCYRVDVEETNNNIATWEDDECK